MFGVLRFFKSRIFSKLSCSTLHIRRLACIGWTFIPMVNAHPDVSVQHEHRYTCAFRRLGDELAAIKTANEPDADVLVDLPLALPTQRIEGIHVMTTSYLLLAKRRVQTAASLTMSGVISPLVELSRVMVG